MQRFQVIPAAYLLLLRDGTQGGHGTEVLLQLRGPEASYLPGHWASGAAGHIEYGESVAFAAAREAAEELGVVVSPEDVDPLCVVQRTEPGNPDPIEQRVDYFVTARRWHGDPQVLEPGKCEALRWFALRDLPDPMPAHERRVLQALAAGDVPAILSHGF